MPWTLPWVRKYGKLIPIPWVSGAAEARDKLRNLAAKAVEDAMAHKTDRKDILGVLVDSVDPETGKAIPQIELQACVLYYRVPLPQFDVRRSSEKLLGLSSVSGSPERSVQVLICLQLERIRRLSR